MARVRVLVVDDDRGIRDMLGIALLESGHEPVASDGRSIPRLDGIDVAIVDLRLGNRTAHELLAEVPGLAELPLIVTTAAEEAVEATQGIPAAVLLRKPFDLVALDDAIATALRRRASRESTMA